MTVQFSFDIARLAEEVYDDKQSPLDKVIELGTKLGEICAGYSNSVVTVTLALFLADLPRSGDPRLDQAIREVAAFLVVGLPRRDPAEERNPIFVLPGNGSVN